MTHTQTSVQVQYIVSGQVQGVFFRASTQSKAVELGLTGWVMNQPDGTVRIEAEGSREKLEQFEAFLWEGPEYARVKAVERREGNVVHYNNFDIR